MRNQFDELAKGMAQSVTRRAALKKFGAGLAGIALALLGLAEEAEAHPHFNCTCVGPTLGCKSTNGGCFKYCLCVCSGGGGRPC